MKTRRIDKNKRSYVFFGIRKRYQEKRRSKKWKSRKIHKIMVNNHRIKRRNAPYVKHTAPDNFSFIENTDEVLQYFEEAKKIYTKKENVQYDISNISNMSPETITLLVSHIGNPVFIQGGNSSGNAPQKPELNKLFIESGFGDHVTNSSFTGSRKGNLLHREVHTKVRTDIAEKAFLNGIEHIYGYDHDFEPLYNILIECMSNTDNHANLDNTEKCRWWLYTYNKPQEKKSTYTFLDLGIGIFESHHAQKYIAKFGKNLGFSTNKDLVPDLLSGKIKSRIKKDNEIRGRGIEEIVGYAKKDCFLSFTLISNDIKINLKTGEAELLNHNFKGTMLCWELTKD